MGGCRQLEMLVRRDNQPQIRNGGGGGRGNYTLVECIGKTLLQVKNTVSSKEQVIIFAGHINSPRRSVQDQHVLL